MEASSAGLTEELNQIILDRMKEKKVKKFETNQRDQLRVPVSPISPSIDCTLNEGTNDSIERLYSKDFEQNLLGGPHEQKTFQQDAKNARDRLVETLR